MKRMMVLIAILFSHCFAFANEEEAVSIFDRYMENNGYFYFDYKGKYDVVDVTKPNIYSILLRAKKKTTGGDVNICGVIMVEGEESRYKISECFPRNKEEAVSMMKPMHALLKRKGEEAKRRASYEKVPADTELPKVGSEVNTVDVIFGKESVVHTFPAARVNSTGERDAFYTKYIRTADGSYGVDLGRSTVFYSIKNDWIVLEPKKEKYMPIKGKIGEKVKTPSGQVVEFVRSLSLWSGVFRTTYHFKGPCIILTTPSKNKFQSEDIQHFCAPFGHLENGGNKFDVGSYDPKN